MHKLLLLLLSLVPFLPLSSPVGDCHKRSLDLVVPENSRLLNARPYSFKKGRPNASVGVILYAYKNGSPYLLMGQERPGKKGGGTYCELGGSMELKEGFSETFGQGLLRELKEESAGVYDLDMGYLEAHSDLVKRLKSNGREEIYAFVMAPRYVPAEVLLRATKAAKDSNQKEKSRFLWIKVESLRGIKGEGMVRVTDIKGKVQTVPLRSFFQNFMADAQSQNILKRLMDKKTTDNSPGVGKT